jgi:hypothetical protein
MSIDRCHLGFALSKFSVVVAAERVKQFAEAIGETDPDLVSEFAPPTFLKVVEGEGGSSRRIVDELGIDLRRILHAEQHFEYLAPVRVGETLTVERWVADIYEKKNGEMEFVVIESSFSGAAEQLVARSRQIILVRNPVREKQDGH